MRRDDHAGEGPIRRAFLRVEPWLLGGIVVFPWMLAAVRWLISLAS